ncbi:transcription-repair coupling factor [Helicobacter sp.]|uniref:transcription-repair coupling factor n=1 Tax=Helicobacter sp. TaxID=218 RepID=UPI00258F9538|nr:transcription-repair coupling factor [Helicobacter sp.]MCI7046638.1 transcription-repair coupling factor [Helicobacter sp.]
MVQSSFYEFLKAKKDGFAKTYSKGLIGLAKDKNEAQRMADVASFLGFDSYVLEDFRAVFGEDLRSYQDELGEIFKTLKRFYESKEQKILLTPLQTLLNPMPKLELLEGFSVEFGECLELKSFQEKLLYFGYEFVELVEVKGEVSIRGDIIDLFLPNFENPIRISLFDNEIESMRFFDVQTQLCIQEELEQIEILPAFFNLNEETYEKLVEKIEESHLQNALQLEGNSIASYGLWFVEGTQNLLEEYPYIKAPNLENLLNELLEFKEQNQGLLHQILEHSSLEISKNYEDFECAFRNIPSFLEFHKHKKITLIAKTEALVRQAGITPSEHKDYEFVLGKDYGVWILGKEELILSLNVQQKQTKKRPNKILIDELKTGDYVVHIDYGVAVFNGIIQANIFGATRDFIELKYLGEDKLLLPVENLDRVDRYIADGGIPILDRLGKGSFVKLKEKIKEKLFVIANGIIALAAKRELIDGIIIDTNKEEILVFQGQSGFVYTKDQSQAIQEIFKDLSSGRVMDRLLSGDVGFGKTEVAMNAMLACFLSGYQAAIIAPTTLLAYQHFSTIKARFENFGVKMARLDRYVSAKEKKSILEGLKQGSVDIVVGTHALLSAVFKKLALIVVDEEHKFGVKQKERIKEISQNIHLLSMSATPIPRTLNMALSHIKGLSELKEAPSQRLPTRTFVKTYSDSLLKEVVLRELRRGGQVFYIHNNIASINQRKEEVLSVIPHLKIAILHSQISAQESEDIIMEFAKGEFNLLLCTSIVESGIHLPNANTILVDRSDCFGIADLHQLRGRVGRGSKEGFCYFLIEDSNKITQEAQKRLMALEKNAYLGSGGALAYHDLEIRGGGNLLGEAQSGHIKNIGYSLYLRMLEEAIYQLSGNVKEEKANIDVKLSVTAFLNPELIASEKLRLEIYRRLSRCEEESAVYGIESEIEERFGSLDIYTKQFIGLIIIKIKARMRDIVSVLNYQQNITFMDSKGEKKTIVAKSKDEEDILEAVMEYLK